MDSTALAIAFAVVNVLQLLLVEALRIFPFLNWTSSTVFRTGVTNYPAYEVKEFFIDGATLSGLTPVDRDQHLFNRRTAILDLSEFAVSTTSLVVGFVVSIIALSLSSYFIGRSQVRGEWHVGALVATIVALFSLLALLYQVQVGKLQNESVAGPHTNVLLKCLLKFHPRRPLFYLMIVLACNAYVIWLALAVSL
jgi:hypothetical protein